MRILDRLNEKELQALLQELLLYLQSDRVQTYSPLKADLIISVPFTNFELLETTEDRNLLYTMVINENTKGEVMTTQLPLSKVQIVACICSIINSKL